MGVPFRPGGVDPGPDFLSTLTRSFMQARNLVDEDTERRRARERFETEQARSDLQMQALQQELRLRGEEGERAERTAAIGEAQDPTIVRRPEGAANPLAEALQPGQESVSGDPGTAGTPSGLVPVEGQPGLFIDPSASQRQAHTARADEAKRVGDMMEQIAAETAATGDIEEAQRIRDAIPRAILDIHQGRQPDTAEMLTSRERRQTMTPYQSATIAQREEEAAGREKQQQEDSAMERILQEDAHRKLKELKDPAAEGDFVPGRDYERQLANARAGARSTGRGGVDPQTLTLRDALGMVREDPSAWSPNTGYKIPLRDALQRAEALVESSRIRGSVSADVSSEGVEPVELMIVNQAFYDAAVAEMGEEYARMHFKVGG